MNYHSVPFARWNLSAFHLALIVVQTGHLNGVRKAEKSSKRVWREGSTNASGRTVHFKRARSALAHVSVLTTKIGVYEVQTTYQCLQ
jgi:hypothetical protein